MQRSVFGFKLLVSVSLVSSALLAGCGIDDDHDNDNGRLFLDQDVAQTAVKGQPSDGEELDSTDLSLTFATDVNPVESGNWQVDGYECRHNEEQEFKSCDGEPYKLSGLKPGSEHTLTVRGMLQATDGGKKAKAKDKTVKVKVAKDAKPSRDESEEGPSGLPVVTAQIGQSVGLGDFYSVAIPEGMHVTEYATTKTRGGMTVFFVLPESDPHYIGNDTCDGRRDRRVQSLSPAGNAYTYCHKTPRPGDYSADVNFRLARNHVEIASDIASDRDADEEIVSLSAYDWDFDAGGHLRSFFNLCANRTTTTLEVPLLNGFYRNEAPQRVMLTMCETLMADAGGNLALWKVAGFRSCDILPVGTPTPVVYPDMPNSSVSTTAQVGAGLASSCRGSIDVTYLARPNGMDMIDEYFARRAQDRLLAVLLPVFD